MIAIQIGIIIFLLLILAIVYQDENRKRRLARKSAKVNRFWNGNKERRKSVRLDMEIDVLYEVISANADYKQHSVSRNISVGGINLALDEKLFPGTILKLQLNLPNNPRPIFTQGKTVWVKEISKEFIKDRQERIFATGIQFIQMNANDEAILRSFINQRIKSSSGVTNFIKGFALFIKSSAFA